MNAKKNPSQDKVEILVVEDSPTQAESLKHILEREGFRITVAGDGDHALALLGERKPTIVITDIIMPGMNGYELCKRIKSDERTSEIPVILLTSLTSSEDVLEGLACGADNFITKPYSEEYLVSIIRRILASGEIRKSERVRIGVEVLIGGKRRFITADQQQMLSLLLSTYEAAVQRNIELTQAQDQLRALNERLEDLVKERTAELSKEILERKAAEERERHLNAVLRAIRGVNQLIVREKRRDRLIQTACDRLMDARDINGVWIVLTDRLPDRVEAVQKGFREETFSALVSIFKKGEIPVCFRRAQADSGIIVNRNPLEECEGCPLANDCEKAVALLARIEHDGRDRRRHCLRVE
jgi:DNA-binding response OmpR family regulator